MTSQPEAPSVPQRLIAEARTRTKRALGSWHDSDYGVVALLAPAAVELLSKAALWNVNPALLTPSGDGMENALVKFARGGDPEAPDARTASLHESLKRVGALFPQFPLPPLRVKRLVSARNGSAHIGATSDVRFVLLDCVAVLDFLLDQLHEDRDAFYGADRETVDALAIEHQESVEAGVRMRMARARTILERRREQDGEEYYTRLDDREAARMTLNPDNYIAIGTSTDQECPTCARTGRLFGLVDAEAEVEWDVEPLGNGQYEHIPHGYWQAVFTPDAFRCTVCDLELIGREKLRVADLPCQRFELSSNALDEPGFDFQALTDAKSDYELPW